MMSEPQPADLAQLGRGGAILARRAGSSAWIETRLEIVSGNGIAILLSAPEGLGSAGRGFAIDASTGRMVLALLFAEGRWLDIHTQMTWALRPAPD
jgi:hypothetical protein